MKTIKIPISEVGDYISPFIEIDDELISFLYDKFEIDEKLKTDDVVVCEIHENGENPRHLYDIFYDVSFIDGIRLGVILKHTWSFCDGWEKIGGSWEKLFVRSDRRWLPCDEDVLENCLHLYGTDFYNELDIHLNKDRTSA